jgi:predicted O-methyltransferase YrrM
VSTTLLIAGGLGAVGAAAALGWRYARWQQRRFDRIEAQIASCARNAEAAAWLAAAIRPSLPLATGNWAASCDFLALLARTILLRRPRLVLECGSGSSTVVAAYALKRAGGGRLVSLDHAEEYAERTRAELAAHGLRDVAEVRVAPLEPCAPVDGLTTSWYATRAIDDLQGIDLLVVDGPPAFPDPTARIGALPVLGERLSPDGIVLLDDADRAGERSCIARWQAMDPALQAELVRTDKGAAVLTWLRAS